MATSYTPTRFMADDSSYDKRKADFAVAFIQTLRHTKGRWAGKPFKLLGWQETIVRDLFGTIKPDGYRQFTTAYVEIPKKMGKQVALDTLIPTPAGFTTMGQIRVGDEVFDETGRVCRVEAKSRVDYAEQAYRIRFKDGEVIEAGENHQWAGQTTHGKPRDALMTTGEIYRTAHDGQCWRFRIPVAGALDLPEADLPVEPYLMGYWLGNGTATKPYVTIQTCDVSSVLERVWPWSTLSTRYSNTGDSVCVRVEELTECLVDSFRDKVIPAAYLRASYGQRLESLQGLMDSDGSISTRK